MQTVHIKAMQICFLVLIQGCFWPFTNYVFITCCCRHFSFTFSTSFFFGFLGVLRPIKKSLLLKRLLLYLISSCIPFEKECRMCRSRTCPYVGGVLSNSWVLRIARFYLSRSTYTGVSLSLEIHGCQTPTIGPKTDDKPHF